MVFTDEGFEKIPCHIRRPPDDELDAKAISIGENLTQLPVTLADAIDACDVLFKKYGDEKIVAKKYGISEKIVKKYVKFERLPAFLKERVESKQIRLDIALKVIDALDWTEDGRESSETLLAIITEVEKLKKSNRRAYKNALRILARPKPRPSISEVIREAQIHQHSLTLRIKLTEEDFERLLSSDKRQPKRHPWDQGFTVDELVIDIIHDYLVRAEVEDY